MNTRSLLASLFILLSLGFTSCQSVDDGIFTYSEADYTSALENGDDIFLDFFAPWCPICVQNQSHIDAAFSNYPNITHFVVNYDDSEALKKEFGVFQQSTYVLIPNGHTENYHTLGPALLRQTQFEEFLELAN